MVGRMVALDEQSFQAFLSASNTKRISRIILIAAGIGYGAISIMSNAAYVESFDSQLLQNVLVPFIFIVFGILTAWLTKVGFSLLLWASAKGLGGKGLLRQISLAVPVILIPGMLGVPFLSGTGLENPLYLVLLVISLVWMYLISVKIIMIVEKFDAKKAYIAVALAFIFMASIYYLVIPAA
ncbi:hypothetical protein [Planococcus lenghuensis]|uniref:Yip1 domain-containing protein n=1 Tax=Planococcus lenghuensis TaxID=2213202 RepID=A0A1Q2KWK9_9BACL|nr:hypothetical protein [Planococcus lenghuensis]AQQ52569.1 hypothetical protein B0X71_05305 [Planococcus lenghuensis]